MTTAHALAAWATRIGETAFNRIETGAGPFRGIEGDLRREIREASISIAGAAAAMVVKRLVDLGLLDGDDIATIVADRLVEEADLLDELEETT